MLKIYTDASTKGDTGLSGGGVLIVGPNIHEQLSFPLGKMDNHEAEFATLITALEYLQDTTETLFFHTDSKVVSETLDRNHTKNPVFAPYLARFNQLSQQFPLVIVKWIPESENKGADHLARQGLKKNKS